MEHWRGLLRGLDSSLHSLLFVRGSWAALKATLTEFAAKNHHSIVRSAIHLQLIKPLPPPPPPAGAAAAAPSGGGAVAATTLLNGSSGSSGSGASSAAKAGKKPAAELPAWCPGHQMVCREFGLNPAALPGPEAELFVEQAAIAVRACVAARPRPAVLCRLQARQLPVPSAPVPVPGWGIAACIVRASPTAVPYDPLPCRRFRDKSMHSASTAAGSAAACGASWRIGETFSTTASTQVGVEGMSQAAGVVGWLASSLSVLLCCTELQQRQQKLNNAPTPLC